MTVNRRLVLAGGSCLLIGGGAAAWVATRAPAAAMEPWRRTFDEPDPRLRALAWAVLAPNPHNRQPWSVALNGSDGITVFCDLDRRLPETDPFDRQLVIGFGCFLELLRMAAAADGWEARIEAFPAGEPQPRLDGRPIAAVRFVRMAAPRSDPLFAHVRDRRSYKEPFDTDRPVPADVARAMVEGSPAKVSVEPAFVEAMRDLTWRAWQAEATTPRTHQESVRLMRIGRAEVERQPDGIDITGPFPELLRHAGLLTRETMADPASTAFAQGHDLYRSIIGTGMGYVWLTGAGDGRRGQLAAGRDWLRLNLRATGLGLALHPISQALQEYAEMEELRIEAGRRLEAGSGVVQMLGRIGYGPAVPPSPRWPIEARIVAA